MYAKTKSQLLAVIGAAAAIIGLVLAAVGYGKNTDNTITKEDVLIFAGFFLIMIGLVLAVNGAIGLVSRQRALSGGEAASQSMDSSEKIKRLAYAALFAALSYIGFQYFRFDLSVGGEKTAFHLGNTFVVLAALFLGGTWGGMAGAIGLTIADFTSGYVTSAPKTFFLKLCIGLITGLVAHTICHLSRIHGSKKILRVTLIASICGLAFNIVADPLVGYFYKKYLFGLPQDIASALAKLSSLTTTVNAILSAMLSVVIYTALRPALEKSGMFLHLEKER